MLDPDEIRAKLIEIDETLNRLAGAPGELAGQLRETALKRKQELQAQLASASRIGRATPDVKPDPTLLDSRQMVFCLIPMGAFLFGQRAKKVELDRYWIGKYPVTNAQFEQFVNDRGYQRPEYWQAAGEAGAWTPEGFRSRFDSSNRSLSAIGASLNVHTTGPRTAPVSFAPPFDLPLHPVVGISWYEALAYVNWMNDNVSGWADARGEVIADDARDRWDGLRAGKLKFALPTEMQWEKAARGTQGRIYPWRGEFDPGKANTSETGLSTTSPVGSFPAGESAYGLLDASGNVWEWTATAQGGTLVACGGSFYYPADKARCTARRWDEPDYWLWDIGFRVAVSPPGGES